MNDIDLPIDGFEVSEILVSDIPGDKLWILRKVKSESGCQSNHAVAVPYRLFGCVIRRMNDQQPTVSPELFIQGANHSSIQSCDSIRLVPTISCDQHQLCAGCVEESGMAFTHPCRL